MLSEKNRNNKYKIEIFFAGQWKTLENIDTGQDLVIEGVDKVNSLLESLFKTEMNNPGGTNLTRIVEVDPDTLEPIEN